MVHEEIRRMASRMLADADAGHPGRGLSESARMTVSQAYELQSEVARLRAERGETLIGYKIGCVSRAIQEQLGIDQPIFGRLFDTGCFPSGAHLSYARYTNLAIEGELAIRLAEDVPNLPMPDENLWPLIATVFPVIELHNEVLSAVGPSCAALVASNGMHAGFVLADEEIAWSNGSCRIESLCVRINDKLVGTVTDPWTLGGPLATLQWLAGRLNSLGLRLLRGQLILTGSPMRLFPVTPHCSITVEARPRGTSRAEIGP